MQKPSLGRIVLVPMNPQSNNGSPEAPAIITRVWSDISVNVRVLADNSYEPAWRTSAEYVESLDVTRTDSNVWTWPPRV